MVIVLSTDLSNVLVKHEFTVEQFSDECGLVTSTV